MDSECGCGKPAYMGLIYKGQETWVCKKCLEERLERLREETEGLKAKRK